MSDWQLIETAPLEEDHPILTWNGSSHHVCVVGWYEDGKPVWFNGDVAVDATHWTTLPAPPNPATPP